MEKVDLLTNTTVMLTQPQILALITLELERQTGRKISGFDIVVNQEVSQIVSISVELGDLINPVQF